MNDSLPNHIKNFVTISGWIKNWDIINISFLAAGEYNTNYLIETKNKKFVFRINTQSQLGLEDKQIEYEYNVLKALSNSRVTPIPHEVSTNFKTFGKGVLLMDYLPGKSLDYKKDIIKASQIFGIIHNMPCTKNLIVQKNPVLDIANESFDLLNKFKDHPLKKEQKQILDYYDLILKTSDSSNSLFQKENMCIVNTEVNSGNFLINEDKSYLIDWEKAVISYRYQDLGHFLVPTTTLWKTDICLDENEKNLFLKNYKKHISKNISFDELKTKTKLMEKTILLRALSWCFMAWYEYTKTERSLKNNDTFSKIKQYLSDIPWILKSVI